MTLRNCEDSSLKLIKYHYFTSTDGVIGVCSWLFPVSLVGGGFSVTVPTDAVPGSVWGSVTIPIAFLIAGIGTIAPGGTCFANSVKLSVIFSAKKLRNKYKNIKIQ